MREVEAKFRVHGLFELPELADHGPVAAAGPARRFELRATYYDTADLRLARWGITLRHRSGGHDAGWTLKLPAGAPEAREEITAPGGARGVPATLRELVTGYTRGAPLRAVARLDTDRTAYPLLTADGEPLAELVDDVVSVQAGERVVATFRELEVEVAPGAPDPAAVLRPVTERLTAAGAVAGEFVPKAVRALGPRATEPPEPPPPGDPSAADPAAAAVTAYLRNQVRAFVVQDAAVRRDLPDSVHQMRVAARRFRSGLRTFGPLLDPDWTAPLVTEVQWIAHELGGARDREVLLERLLRAVDEIPEEQVLGDVRGFLADRLGSDLAGARAVLLAALRTKRYTRLLDELVGAATAPRLTEAAERPAADALPPLVAGTCKALGKKVRRLRDGNAPDADYHRARIAAKRARYAAEACVPALGKPAKQAAQTLAEIQEVLGEHQDAVVAGDLLRQLAEERGPGTGLGFTLGLLHAGQRVAADRSRQTFHEVWEIARRGRLRRWLES